MGRGHGAWREIKSRQEDEIWDEFTARFAFRPSVHPEHWPSFKEPRPSRTWSISEQLDRFDPWMRPEAAPHDDALVRALRKHVQPADSVWALDWQHQCYEFFPHRLPPDTPPAEWKIPALPSGEYHLYLSRDLSFGSLGHPWEETLCVFGSGFLQSYEGVKPDELKDVVRRNGRPV